MVIALIYIAVAIFSLVCLWRVFEEADQPGWGSIVPIYSTILLCDIGGVSLWWTLASFIPVVNIVAAIVI